MLADRASISYRGMAYQELDWHSKGGQHSVLTCVADALIAARKFPAIMKELVAPRTLQLVRYLCPVQRPGNAVRFNSPDIGVRADLMVSENAVAESRTAMTMRQETSTEMDRGLPISRGRKG